MKTFENPNLEKGEGKKTSSEFEDLPQETPGLEEVIKQPGKQDEKPKPEVVGDSIDDLDGFLDGNENKDEGGNRLH